MGHLAALFARLELADAWTIAERQGLAAGVDPALVMAVIAAESSFVTNATHQDADGGVSYGLMQLRLETARLLAGRPVTSAELVGDPDLNVQLGTRYLADNLRRYGNTPDAVAAYNAGRARKDAEGRYVNSKGVPAVQAYVDRVLANYALYAHERPALAAGATPEISLTVSGRGAPVQERSWGALLENPWAWGVGIAVGLALLLAVRR